MPDQNMADTVALVVGYLHKAVDQIFYGSRFVHIPDRAFFERLKSLFINRDELNRNVSSSRIVL